MVGGAVLIPPYEGARAFAEWAVELWPYINGKGLVNGLQLQDMDMTEMLDVLHYFFEEDLRYVSEEEIEASSTSREVVYRNLYKTNYRYSAQGKRKNRTTSQRTASGFEESYPTDGYFGDDIQPFDPVKNERKPYIPPTDFEEGSPLPFGEILDAPLN